MGLDIYLYTNIKRVFQEEGQDDDDFYDDVAFTNIQIIPKWYDRSQSLEKDATYDGESIEHIGYGYSTHSYFRNNLGMLIGLSDSEWLKVKDSSLPFYNLFDFGDNEGCFDYAIIKILKQNFEDYKEKITTHEDEYFRTLFNKWLNLLSEAKEGDVVVFR